MTPTSNHLLGIIPAPGLLFGLMLAAAIVGGYLARLVHVPRVVGFLLGGVALRAALSAVVGAVGDESSHSDLEAAAEPLAAIKDLALGLILFNIGGVFERTKLKAVSRRVWKISTLEIALVLLFVSGACTFTAWLLGPSGSGSHAVVLGVLLGTAAIATAPAATLFVLQEYEAKGPVTDTVVGLTAVNNIVCIVLFQVAFTVMASLGAIRTAGSVSDQLGTVLLCTTVGSVLLGVVIGCVLSIVHGKLPLPQTLLFFFAVFILVGTGEDWLWRHMSVSYNALLTALIIGAVFANVAIDSGKLEAALGTVAWPVFAAFFVLAGYDLHLRDLASMGWLGVVYILARYLAKWLGCQLGVRWADAPDRADGRLGQAMLCQAAVVIGLASFVQRNLLGGPDDLADRFATVILGSVVVFELAGPLLLKRCVVQAGEVKAITLLRRARDSTGDVSVTRLTMRALLRLFGWRPRTDADQPEALTVEHIMRTNVQFIRAEATFDEVLHEIERSTHSHFPVVREDGAFAGVIHFSDVRDVIYDPALSQLVTAVDLADADSPTVPSSMPLRELLDLFTAQNVAVLPVVARADSPRVVGLVEQRDLLRALHLSQDSR